MSRIVDAVEAADVLAVCRRSVDLHARGGRCPQCDHAGCWLRDWAAGIVAVAEQRGMAELRKAVASW